MEASVGYWPVKEDKVFALQSQQTHQMRQNYIYRPQTQPAKHTTDPIVTGTSVLGIKYKDGVMLAADTLASYGSLARFREIQRLEKVGNNTLIGASGEVSDFQFIMEDLNKIMTQEFVRDDGYNMTAPEVYSYMSRVMYNRRSKMDPYYNALVIGGLNTAGAPFLGYVDMYGTTYEDNTIATGYGNYLARPLLRKYQRNDMSEEEAKKLLEDSLRVLFYRDARSTNKIQLAKVTKDGVVISPSYELETNWDIGKGVSH